MITRRGRGLDEFTGFAVVRARVYIESSCGACAARAVVWDLRPAPVPEFPDAGGRHVPTCRCHRGKAGSVHQGKPRRVGDDDQGLSG